jgi:GNAT superfamily N-acetyltransferase
MKAYKLARGIFPHEATEVSRAFIASLMPKPLLPIASGAFSAVRLKSLDYFLALDGTGKVVGVTGLYCVEDRQEVWVGWYGVAPSERGRGYGKGLLNWTIQTAERSGFHILRLWTLTSGDHARANALYAKRGFVRQELEGDDSSHPPVRSVLYGLGLHGQPPEPFKGDLREALLGATASDFAEASKSGRAETWRESSDTHRVG